MSTRTLTSRPVIATPYGPAVVLNVEHKTTLTLPDFHWVTTSRGMIGYDDHHQYDKALTGRWTTATHHRDLP